MSGFSVAGRTKSSVPVVSPFPDQPARHRPRWWERIRGIGGMALVVAVTGFVLALTIALTLVAVAVFVTTAFN